MQKDSLLLFVVELANTVPETEIVVTLVTGGMLITGKVIGSKEYFAHSTVSAAFLSIYDEHDRAHPPTEDELAKRAIPDFIHLADAQYLVPGQEPVPAAGGVFSRVALRSISAFSFGRAPQTEERA